ncbi:MAG: ABC transporter ATP-binding protein, partial [bacterium]|nr:ABC transporter ATP-binding protein [bacterium]
YGSIIDTVIINSTEEIIFYLLGIWVLTSLFSAILGRVVSLNGVLLGVDALAESAVKFSSHIIDLPMAFHKENKIGETVSKINMAGDALQTIIGDTLFWIVPRFLTMFIGLGIMFFINWKLSAGTLVVFLLSVIVAVFRTNLLTENQKTLNRKFEKAGGIINDSFSNIQTIKSSGAGDFQKDIIKNVYYSEIKPSFRKVSVNWENTDFFQEAVFSLGFVAVFGYAVFLLGEGVISNGVLVMFLGYLNLTRLPLRVILWQWLSVQRDMAAIKKAFEFFSVKPERFNKGGKILKNAKGKVEYENIHFGYKGRKNVLKNISFSAKPGQKVALVGGSGEGKTTIVDLLSLYFFPRKGRIMIDGVNIRNLKLNFLRGLIAYVPQETILFNDTIKNNILYGKPDATKEEVLKAARAANIDVFIDTLPKKYNTLVGERGVKLSAGQRQRLAIARAVIRNPKILILDEATSSLDVKSEKMVQEALDNLIKDKTTLIIAHRLSTIRRADKILVIEKGEIAESGTHEQLIRKKGFYYDLYSLQFKKTKKM